MRVMRSSIGCLVIFLTLSLAVIAQRDVSKQAIGTPYVGVHFGMNLTGGDLSERYGFSNHLGAIAGYKTKGNWLLAADGNFMFGNDIRVEGILDNLRDAQGTITNSSGAPAQVLMFLRGFNVNATLGKVIPVWSPNPNSGIMVQFGVGYLWHRIRIETQEDEVPQLQDEYLKGYDRLTIGLNTSQFIGYNFMANQGVVNFYAGFYFQQGFTRNQRDLFWDFPDQPVSQDIRNEYQYGFKIGWLVPVYKRQPKDFYFD
jgi:hypothetical protein